MQFSCIGPLRCFKMWLQSVGAAEIFQKRPDAKDKRHNEQQSDNEGIAKTAEMIANSESRVQKISSGLLSIPICILYQVKCV